LAPGENEMKMRHQYPEQIVEELRAIRRDIDYIKTHMVDADTVLSKKDKESIRKALLEHRQGKTIPLEEFEKKQGKDVSSHT